MQQNRIILSALWLPLSACVRYIRAPRIYLVLLAVIYAGITGYIFVNQANSFNQVISRTSSRFRDFEEQGWLQKNASSFKNRAKLMPVQAVLSETETEPLVQHWGVRTKAATSIATDGLKAQLTTAPKEKNEYRYCPYNRPYPRPHHACVVDSITKIPYCQIENLQINVEKVDMKADGGEPLATVMGQAESDEFPRYQPGAFVTTGNDVVLADDRSNFFYLNDVVSSLVVQKTGDLLCTERIPGLTLMITRYEYCNAYHTMTDWFNAFLSLSDTPAGNVTVVFLDGHPEGKLDEVWSHLWGNVKYVKQLAPGGVCFDHVTFIPAGYASVLWPRDRTFPGLKPCPSMMDAFVKFFVEHYSLQDIPKQRGRVTIIDRIPYLAHPRSEPHIGKRTILNLNELARSIRSMEGVTDVQLVRFEEMTFEEQLLTIRETHILIGNHGAGISHLLFLQDDSFVLEFAQDASSMFVEFARWKPKVQHILLSTLDSNVIPQDMIEREIVPKVTTLLSKAKAM